MTTKLTITEALAELKTISKRINKKKEFILTYLLRQDAFKDPLEKDGGSVSAIAAETQSIRDLESRAIGIRMAITNANLQTQVTVGDVPNSIAEWLIWRRDIAPGRQEFNKTLRDRIARTRQEATKKGLSVGAVGEITKPDDVIVNLNEKTLAAEAEKLEQLLGDLDGQLSLKNATTFVEV